MWQLLAQSTNNDAVAGAMAGGMFMIQMIFAVIGYVVMAVALMTIANKTGKSEKSWWAWIPILNFLLMLEIAGLPLWYIILMLIPCVNLFVLIYTWWKIAEARGKPGPIAIALIIPVVGFFVPLYIAFSD